MGETKPTYIILFGALKPRNRDDNKNWMAGNFLQFHFKIRHWFSGVTSFSKSLNKI